jgi:hypothetical protein
MGILASGVALCHLLSFLPMKERVCEEDKRLLVFFFSMANSSRMESATSQKTNQPKWHLI